MSKNKKTNFKDAGKPWKEFERLVSKIEEALCPAGAIVKVNEKIPDVQTGDLRQVDATIRFRVGSSDILIAIECRKRNHKQDITWIEQLEAKKKNIGANQIIGVSSDGFTDYALRKAKVCNVTLRKIDKIDVSKMINKYRSVITETRDIGQSIKFDFSGQTREELEYITSMFGAGSSDSSNKKIFVCNFITVKMSGNDLVSFFYNKFKEDRTLNFDQEYDSFSIAIDIPHNAIFVESRFGNIYLRKLEVEFSHLKKVTKISDYDTFVYSDENNNKLSETIQFKHTLLNGNEELYHYNVANVSTPNKKIAK